MSARMLFLVSIFAIPFASALGKGSLSLAQEPSGQGYALENGDSNGDQVRDLSDALYLFAFLFLGGPDPVPLAYCGLEVPPVQNGDTNADDAIDVSDPVHLLGWLFLGRAEPVEACGSGFGEGAAANPNPRVIPPHARAHGGTYEDWAIAFSRHIYSIPASQNPVLGNGTCEVGQSRSSKVWFLPGGVAPDLTNLCTMPAGKSLLFPVPVYVNPFPCPDPAFAPAPGQSLEDFLTETARAVIDLVSSVEVEIDGRPLGRLQEDYRVTTGLFTLTGDVSLVAAFDPCITGEPQPAVADGYWLLLAPLPLGEHTMHIRIVFAGTELVITNVVTVVPLGNG